VSSSSVLESAVIELGLEAQECFLDPGQASLVVGGVAQAPQNGFLGDIHQIEKLEDIVECQRMNGFQRPPLDSRKGVEVVVVWSL